jgi:hypothetical protein
VVKEVIYPAVGEQTLDALIREADAVSGDQKLRSNERSENVA